MTAGKMIRKWLQNVDGNLSGYFHYFAGSGMAIDDDGDGDGGGDGDDDD